MNPIFGLLTQLFVSKGPKHLDGDTARRERGKVPWTDEQKKQLAEYERQDRNENWRLVIIALCVLAVYFTFAWWANHH